MDPLPDLQLFEEQRGAQLSDCGKFRYHLHRQWGEGKTLLFVMLNPSTADGTVDDRTSAKCVRYARIFGFTAMEIVNLFAYRATDPDDLAAAGFPVGRDNDAWIRITVARIVAEGGKVCVAWGANVPSLDRPREVLRILAEEGAVPHALKVTKDGHPAHPLYLSSMCKLTRYELP